ncbi:MAG: hypothetical protein AMK69_09945 [Nitrospira bacterium SG8_3]|nr:MAG: hypothetical protein AMK69_09945 [Nitrospira bacterium SG8_3]
MSQLDTEPRYYLIETAIGAFPVPRLVSFPCPGRSVKHERKKSPRCGVLTRGLKKEPSMKDFIKPYYQHEKARKMSRYMKAQGLEAHMRGASA